MAKSDIGNRFMEGLAGSFLNPRVAEMGRGPEFMMNSMQNMMASGHTLGSRYEDLDMLRDTEGADVGAFLEELEPYVSADPGYAIDLGSGCGFIAGELALEFPHLEMVPSEVSVPIDLDPKQFWGMPLLRRTLKRLADDHANKAERRQNMLRRSSPDSEPTEEVSQDLAKAKLYNDLLCRVVEVDVLHPRWSGVEHLIGQCRLVTCTMLMQQKGFETPEMWRMVMVGAARLLAEGGCLFMYDSGQCGGFGKRDVVFGFAKRLGLALQVHEHREDGVDGGGLYAVILQKPAMVSVSGFATNGRDVAAATSNDVATATGQTTVADGEGPAICDPKVSHSSSALQEGDVVEVHGLQGRKDLNGMTAVLGCFVSKKGRWECRIATGVTNKRRVESAMVQPHNLRQLVGGCLLETRQHHEVIRNQFKVP